MSLFFSILGHITNKKRQSSNTLLEGLVAFWPLDESTGTTANDLSGNGYHGTANVTGVLGQTGVKGTYAALFDSVSDRITLPNSSTLLPDDTNFTINAWIRRDANGTQAPLNRVMTFLRNTSSSIYGLGYNLDEEASIYTFNGTTNVYVYGTSTIPTTGASMVTFVKEGSTHKIYLNGVLENSASYTPGYTPSANPAVIGNAGIDNYQLNGAMNWLSLYNDAKTDSEITDLYNNGDGLSYAELGSGTPEETFLTSADYYVSSSAGNDANDGLTQETAWASIGKVNSSTFSSGDIIAFKAGDSFTGTLTPPTSGAIGSPITFSAYGSGNKPKIYGSEVITGWTLHSGNIYKATLANDITQLFISGEKTINARYPKVGWATVTGVTSSTVVTSTDLDAGIDYGGSHIIARTANWAIDGKEVVSSSSQTLTLNTAPSYGLDLGEYFILVNGLSFLTENGEWVYDSSTNTVYAIMPNGDSPANYEVRGSSIDNGISISSKNYIIVENIEVLHQKSIGVAVDNSTNTTVCKIDVKSAKYQGMYGVGNSSLTIENNTVDDSYSEGIRFVLSSSTVKDNVVTNVLSESSHDFNSGNETGSPGRGIATNGDGNTIQYNRVIDMGYVGISFYGANNIIQYNYINGACQMLDDGAAIYTYNGSNYADVGAAGSEVKNNIVLNVIGNRGQGSGIYMDNNTHDVLIEGNTVSTTNNCLNLHQNGDIIVNNNTLMDATLIISTSLEVVDNTITNNILYGTDRLGDYIWFSNSLQRMIFEESATSVLDNNKYYNPYKSNPFRRPGTDVDFATWKSVTGQDANSTFDGTALGVGEVEELFYNDTKVNKAFNLTGSYRDLDGVAVSSPLILSPFTSKILIKE